MKQARMNKTTSIEARMDADLRARVEREAARDEVKLSRWVRDALEQRLARESA